LSGGQGKDLVGGQGNRIGDDHFFGQAANEPPDAVRELFAIDRALLQLRGDGMPAQNGTGDQLRKKEDV